MQITFIITALLGLAFSILLYFPLLALCRKMKASQTTLHYVEKHASKTGTPTMGGIIFIFAVTFASVFFFNSDILGGWLCVVVMLSYGILGFIDDFIKVRFKQNEGLKPYQKIIGQVGLSLIVATYVYLYVGTTLNFFNLEINLGWGIIPFIMLVFIATTNSVNLTDGLDGLASGVGAIFLLCLGVIVAIIGGMETYAILCFAMVGALFGFKVFNTYPAKIFMGDCGSMALGGFIAMVCAMTQLSLLIPVLGIMFVLSALSDIIQVLYYKKTKKRVFLMAPLHHHFEKKGVHENRIVAVYSTITLIMGGLCILLYLVF